MVDDNIVIYLLPALGLAATTLFLHRDGTHHSIALAWLVRMICRILIFVDSGMKPREWIAVHRRHHECSDKPGDPHSPRPELSGFWMVFLGTAILFRRAKNNDPVIRQYITEVPTDRLDSLVFDRGLFGPLVSLPAIQVGLLFHLHQSSQLPELPLFTLYAIAFFLLAGGIINCLGHMAAVLSQLTKDFSKNLNWFLSIVTWGEGVHNDHHDCKESAKFGPNGWKDLGWWLIRALRVVRGVRVLYVKPEWK